jgi:hypothetical protein
MWTEADDHGRGLAEPRHLAGSLFPFDRDVTERKVSGWLRELEDVVCTDGTRGLIVQYESNGSRYYAIRNWWHQKVNRPGDPRYPAPPSGTLFDSLNGAPSDSPRDSVNGTRQGSGVRGQGSGSRSQGSSDRETPREEIDPPPREARALLDEDVDPEDRHALHRSLGVFVEGCPGCAAKETA